jgi:hypothetical protein
MRLAILGTCAADHGGALTGGFSLPPSLLSLLLENHVVQLPSLPSPQALGLIFLYILFFFSFLKNNALFVYIVSNKFLVYV